MATKEATVLYDSRREITDEEVRDFCEADERDLPVEGSDAWNEVVEDIRDRDYDEFRDDCALEFALGKCLATGYADLWHGNVASGAIIGVKRGGDLFQLVGNCDDFKVVLDPDDGLVVYGYHHDGTNRYCIHRYKVRQINDRGLDYVSAHEEVLDRQTLHEKLINGKMTRKITMKMISY